MKVIKRKIKYTLAAVVFVGLGAKLLFINFPAFAENVDFNVNIAPTLTIDVTSGGVATNNITLNLNPNTKTFDHQSADIKVATNNVTGYQLFVSTVDGKTELARDNTDGAFSSTIPTIPTLTPTSPATTGYSESDFRNCTIADCTNKWGYKVTASDTDPSTVTANYFPFVLNTNLATNHYATNGDNTTLDFAAKIDWAQPAGTYENTLVFTATATYAAYHIDYYDGVDNTNTIATQDNAYNTSSTVVLNPVYSGGATGPTRSGLSGDTYTFIKWCDQVPGGETTEGYFKATTCSGNSYNTGDSITIDPTQYSTNINLYAYWDPTTFDEAYAAVGASKSGSYYKMQDIVYNNNNVCNAVTVGEQTQLVDIRSGNYTYSIKKLKDGTNNGRCWMTQNLRFTGNSVNSSNTNINSTVNITWYDLTTANTSSGACYGGTTSSGGTGIGSGYSNFCYHNSGNTTNGVWYNYAAATAGSITGPSNTNDAPYSICSKGWGLPSRSEYNSLFPVNTPALFGVVGGGFYNKGIINTAPNGYWWLSSSAASASSTVTSIYTDAQYFAWNSAGNNLYWNSNVRINGFYVRCIAQN